MSTRFDTALIGCGNLGMAILSRALASGALRAQETLVIEADDARRAAAAALGVQVRASAARDAAGGASGGSGGRGDAVGGDAAGGDAAGGLHARLLLIAVKPQSFEALAQQLGALHADQLVLSVMAGWTSASLRARLGGTARVVRAMPNMPAQIGMAMTAIASGAGATEADIATAQRLFDSVGRTIRIEESQIDAAVAAGGSAPAYLFLLAQAQIEAAIALGLSAEQARVITMQTMLGAATLMTSEPRTPEELRAAVTSKGGTTAAAIGLMQSRGFEAMIAEAMRAARDRSAAMGC